MSFQWLIMKWNDFFFERRSPLPIALFRIIYGTLVVTTLLLLGPDWLNWYGVHGWVRMSTVLKLEPGSRLSLFSIIPQSDAWISALFWLGLGSALLLTLGLFTRINSVLVFLFLTSLQQRNLYITHGGDTFLRLAGFFLIFAPGGAALSLDRLVRLWRGKEPSAVPLQSVWAQRLIQLQLSLLYLAAFLFKIKGAPWFQGTALFYIYHLEDLKRFPVPEWFFRPIALKLGSWGALVLEFSLGTLIWVKQFRYWLLSLGLLFHLWLEYSLNIPLFQWDVLSAYILFVDPADVARIGDGIRRATLGRWYRTAEST
jgi:vitamin K-dependent gamma-carboxylase-like protein